VKPEYKRQIFSASRMLYRRRDLRQKTTTAEDVFWEEVRGNKLGYKFKRQFSIDNYVIDFYCPDFKLAIEIDGGIHKYRRTYDNYRSSILKAYGVFEIRFTNKEIEENLTKVIALIKSKLTSP